MNPIDKAVRGFALEIDGLSPKVMKAIVDGIGTSTDTAKISRVVEAVFKKYGIKSAAQKAILSGVSSAAAAGSRQLAASMRVTSFKRWYLDKAYSPSGVKFKSAIADLWNAKGITETVRRGMSTGKSWEAISRDLRNGSPSATAAKKTISRLVDASRKQYAVTGDSKGFSVYKKEMEKIKTAIGTDITSARARKAIEKAVTITTDAAGKAVTRAVERAIKRDYRISADLIARTEIAGAYSQASHSDMEYNDDIEAWQSVLSDGHPEDDICNFYAEADLYGLGAGIYPKGEGPSLPYHPNCMCIINPVYNIGGKKTGDLQSRGAEMYIRGAGADAQKKLLGVDGAESFQDNPKTWRENLKNYSGMHPQKATIPKAVLYGKE